MVRVTLKAVSKYFGDFKAVDDVSLDVKEDELFFLSARRAAGRRRPSGSSQDSTSQTGGRSTSTDQLINDVPPHRRNVGMVFQNYALWPHMTAYDNIIYGLKVRDVPASRRVERAREALRIVKMSEFATRYPNQLSGGQQQRIALARLSSSSRRSSCWTNPSATSTPS